MAAQLRGKRVAILAADGVERVEVEQPRDALQQAGAETDLLSLHDGEIQARNHDLEAAGTFPVEGLVANASVEDYDALLLPRRHGQPGQVAAGQSRSCIRPRLCGLRQAGCSHLPWPVDAGGGRSCVWSDTYLVRQHPYRSTQCRCRCSRPGGRY